MGGKFYPAHRAQNKANLRNMIKHMMSGRHWRAGRDSGFPDCCNVWYHVRGLSMNAWCIVFGNYGWFYNPDERRKTQHVCCPLHKFLYRNGRGFVYLYCADCNWMELNSERCYRCGGPMVKGSEIVLNRAGMTKRKCCP